MAERRNIHFFCCALFALACGSVMDYVRGPEPPSALPEPKIRIWQRRKAQETLGSDPKTWFVLEGTKVSGESFRAQGRLISVGRGKAPTHGFSIALEIEAGVLLLEAALFKPTPFLDVSPGTYLQVIARRGEEQAAVEILDEKGTVFWIYAGTEKVISTPWGDIEATSKTLYLETRVSEDLCVNTDAHFYVATKEETLAPGEHKCFCHGEVCMFLAVADARRKEEGECQHVPPFSLVVFGLRTTKEQAKSIK